MSFNPFQFMQMMRNGGNPQQMINQLASSNPQYKQIIDSMMGKSPEEMRQYTENLAKERGVDLQKLMNNLGIKNN